MATLKQQKAFTYFVGIDVSRDKLDCVLMFGKKMLHHKVIPNSPLEISQFIKDIKATEGLKLGKTVFGLEQTGIYTSHLLDKLKRAKAHIVIEDAVHIKNSLGKIRGKYDKLDAIRIANYLYKTKGELRLWEQRRQIIDELAHLSTLRNRLLRLYNSMKVPLDEEGGFLSAVLVKRDAELCQDSLSSLKNDILKVEQAIIGTIQSDEHVRRLFAIITSVPYVGTVTAVQIIIATNEYSDITDAKKFASYAGIAPFRNESGTVQGKAKISHLANKKIKALLHICAMASVSKESELRAYYVRKTQEEGKPKMAVLNAIRNKIILRIFACLKHDRFYQKEYVRGAMQGV